MMLLVRSRIAKTESCDRLRFKTGSLQDDARFSAASAAPPLNGTPIRSLRDLPETSVLFSTNQFDKKVQQSFGRCAFSARVGPWESAEKILLRSRKE